MGFGAGIRDFGAMVRGFSRPKDWGTDGVLGWDTGFLGLGYEVLGGLKIRVRGFGAGVRDFGVRVRSFGRFKD